ncbi:thioredoxin family protein [Mollicutes bacterium LVI A0039]|nr:thioredoxin family protein [Mollicutes bacterium LVI A0039]
MEIIKTNVPVLEAGFYLFTTENCPSCEKLKSTVRELEVDTTLYEVEAHSHQEIAMSLNIMGTPCIIDYRDGKEYDRIYGAASMKRLEAFFKGE